MCIHTCTNICVFISAYTHPSSKRISVLMLLDCLVSELACQKLKQYFLNADMPSNSSESNSHRLQEP